MTYDEINTSLKEVQSWKRATLFRQRSFCDAMKDNQYGYEPLLDAWSWFLTGWDARAFLEPDKVT